ncbi:MAG: hypothetical protein AAF125_25660, partial [Chloroflexota bacterium]
LPVVIENISIDMFAVDPNAIVDVVVYEDSNGGSPVDATLVSSTQVSMKDEGVYVAEFPAPVVVNSPIVWIGFYLPVNTIFRADRQGSSVLTYWAWTPGTRFDLSDLSSAQIFGPSDGSSPVNINIGGVAKIRAEAVTANTRTTEALFADDDAAIPEDPFIFLENYPGCPTLFYDRADLTVTYQNTLGVTCRELESWHAFPWITPAGFTRRTNSRNIVYDLAFYDDEGQVLTGFIDPPVTHCVTPALNEQESAVIGIAYGNPRRWTFLTSEREDNLVCAEVNHGGGLSYFTPN